MVPLGTEPGGNPFRSGFAAIVGRPNVGKSTLVNALVGEKVAITSPRPETTRRQIRGIVDRAGYQVVLVDTPGLHRPRTPLGERLNDLVRGALVDVDAVVVCLPADQALGPGDRFLLAALPPTTRRVAAVTKTDLVSRPALLAKLVEVAELAASPPSDAPAGDALPGDASARDAPPGDVSAGDALPGDVPEVGAAPAHPQPGGTPGRDAPRGDASAGDASAAHPPLAGAAPAQSPPAEITGWEAIVPVSAVAGDGIVQLEDVLGALMPLGPRWYPAGVATDEPLTVRVAELVREAALGEMREELPHSVAVLVEEIDGQMIYVSLFVERNSQKGIVLGAKGARLAKIRAVARRQVEALVGHKVSLKIHVKVAKEWQRDPKALRRLGL